MKIQQFQAQRLFTPMAGFSFVIAAGGITRCKLPNVSSYPNTMVVNTGGTPLDIAFCPLSDLPTVMPPPAVSIPAGESVMFLPTEGAALVTWSDDNNIPVMVARAQSGSGSCLFFYGNQEVVFPIGGYEDGIAAFTTLDGFNAFAIGTANAVNCLGTGTYV